MSSYQIGRTLGEASRILAEHLFGKYNIRIFDPAEKEFREFSRKILLRESELGENDKQCNFFCLDNNRRKAVPWRFQLSFLDMILLSVLSAFIFTKSILAPPYRREVF